MINKYKCNKQKTVSKAFSSFHALGNAQARPPTREGLRGSCGPGSGAAGVPGKLVLGAHNSDAHTGHTAGMRVHLPRSLSLGLAPLPGARWERGVAVPAPSPGSGSRPAGIWDEAAGVLEGNDTS